MISRRHVIGGALAFSLMPRIAKAQQAGKTARIGWLTFGTPASQAPYIDAFRRGLAEHGYREGENVVVEYRLAEGRDDRVGPLAADLVRLKPDIIVTSGSRVVRVLKEQTRTIPVVVAVVSDPVSGGFVSSFSRPGGNITGLAFQDSEMVVKRLEFLKEVVPSLSRVAVLSDPDTPGGAAAAVLADAAEASRTLQVKLHVVEARARTPNALEQAFTTARRDQAQAIAERASPFFNANRGIIADLAVKHRLPITCENRLFVVDGCLMSYGPDLEDMFRRAAGFVDRILKGARPGDLPMEQPAKFELAVNLKTAKTLGLTIPPAVLGRADQVVE